MNHLKVDLLSPHFYNKYMADVVNVHDFKTHYSKYLERVEHGEEILVAKHGKTIAKLVPMHALNPRQPGFLKNVPPLPDDFDDPMPELEAYLSEDIDAHST